MLLDLRLGSCRNSHEAWLRIPAALGHRFRKHLGSHSGGTWAPVPDTWALIPAHLGADSGAPGRQPAARAMPALRSG